MLKTIVKNLFGSRNDRLLKDYGKKAQQINLLEDAIVEKDWIVVEQAVEMLRTIIDNPFDGYEKDIDIEEY